MFWQKVTVTSNGYLSTLKPWVLSPAQTVFRLPNFNAQIDLPFQDQTPWLEECFDQDVWGRSLGFGAGYGKASGANAFAMAGASSSSKYIIIPINCDQG